jgi:kynurenine 3-monooxygenase
MKIVVVGGGPAGLLFAESLVKRKSYEVHVYERNPDLRNHDPKSLRTYPIGLQQRGLQAVDSALQEEFFQAGVWINGVTIQGRFPQTMSRCPSLYLDRNLIVYTMLHHITRNATWGEGSSLHLHFEKIVEAIDLDEKAIFVSDIGSAGGGSYVPFDGLVAADGANSIIRSWLAEEGGLDVIEEPVPNNYRTFSIPLTSYDKSIVLESDKVHAWMFGHKSVLMVPGKGGFATGVLIYPAGDDDISGMSSVQQAKAYFQSLSPESLSKFIGEEEAKTLLSRPVNYAKTAKCSQLHANDCILFIGDSAHSVSAAVNQACNAALQDVEIFMKALDEEGDDWYRSLVTFSHRRIVEAHALHELADFTMPTKDFLLQSEFILRTVSKKFLPKMIARHMKDLPNELLSNTNLSYKEIWEQTRWWTEKVRKARMRELAMMEA